MFEEPLKEQLLLICELNNLFYHCTPPFFEGFGNKSIKRRNKSSLLTAKKINYQLKVKSHLQLPR